MLDEQINFLVQLNAKSVVQPRCPFCNEQPDTQNGTYLHIAEHLRQYALMSLPWDTGIVTLSTKESQNAIANRISEQANSSVVRMEDEIANMGNLLFASDSETQEEPANRKGSTSSQNEHNFRALIKSPGLSDKERLDATRFWIDGLPPGSAIQAYTWDDQPTVEQARSQHDEPAAIDQTRSGDSVLPATQSTHERPAVDEKDQSLGIPSESEQSDVDAKPSASAVREPSASTGEEHAVSDSGSEESETSPEEDTPIVRRQKQRAQHQEKLPIAAKHAHGKLVPGRTSVPDEPRTQSGPSTTRSTMPPQQRASYASQNPEPALPLGRLRPNQSASTAQIPWRHSQALGSDFIYNPRTDRIHCSDGRQFARPNSIEVSGLMHARYDGPLPPFQYGSAPPGNLSYMHGVHPATQRHIPTPFQYGSAPPGNIGYMHGIQPATQRQIPTSYPVSPGATLQNLDPARQPVVHRPTQQLSESQARQREPVRVPSSSDRRFIVGNERVTSTFIREYSIRQRNFYDVGRAFLVLWAEPAAGVSTVTTLERGVVLNHLGERVFSKVRRFVVVRQSSTFCNALPISTYAGRGVSKRGVVKSEHVIIYTSRTAPIARADELPRRGEDGMRPVPIRVDPDSRSVALDPMSRLDLGGVTTVMFDLKVKSLGKVSAGSLEHLMQQFAEVWADDDEDEEEEDCESEEEDEGEAEGRANNDHGDDDDEIDDDDDD